MFTGWRAQAAHRELAEETGLSATLGPVLGVFSRWYTEDEAASGEAGHVVGVVYEAAGWRGQLRTEFDDGTVDLATPECRSSYCKGPNRPLSMSRFAASTAAWAVSSA